MKLIQSLFRAKRPNESYLRYFLLLTHLWLGLLSSLVLFVIAVSGAIYVFRDEVEDMAASHLIQRDLPASTDIEINTIALNFEKQFNSAASSFFVPESKSENIKVMGGGHGPSAVIAYADRETGLILGKANPKTSNFFNTVMRIHRWLALDAKRNTGRQIVAFTTCVLIFLLISGLILWLPNKKKANPWKNKFNLRFKYRFSVWNRDLHINLGAITSLLVLFIAFTGICFTYPNLRENTLALLQNAEEREMTQAPQEEHQKGGEHANTKGQRTNEAPQRPANNADQKQGTGDRARNNKTAPQGKANTATAPSINYNALLEQASAKLPYSGDVTLSLGGRRSNDITVRKANTNNTLRAHVSDQVSFSQQGKFKSTILFTDLSAYAKTKSIFKALHTGAIFGLWSKVLYFFLALFVAYLPISGFLMWIKRVK